MIKFLLEIKSALSVEAPGLLKEEQRVRSGKMKKKSLGMKKEKKLKRIF